MVAAANDADMAGSLEALGAEEAEDKKEPKMALFSVIKKGSILKHIFLNVSLRPKIAGADGDGHSDDQGSGQVETILIGRHPDCHIVLDHPSISRFHLELHLSFPLEKLSVVDRFSVHGTWISGTRIPPNEPIDMVDGDVLRLGSSTRLYRLQWVSSSRAFEMENPLPPLLEDPEEPCQEDSGQRIADASEQWVSELPTAPPLIEFMKGSPMHVEKEQHSPACEEPCEENLASFCAAMMSECLGSLPSMVEENWCPQVESAIKESSDVEQSRSPECEKQEATPSLLSMRKKSKSVSCLRIQTGRNQESFGSILADKEADERTEEDNSIVCEHVDQQDTVRRVLFGALDGQEEDKGNSFDSDKENMTPISAFQKTNKNIAVQQKSSARSKKSSARLDAAGDFKEEYEEKQTVLALSDFKHKKSSSKKFAKHQRKEWLFAATSDLTEDLNDFDKMQHEDDILTDSISIESSSQTFDESEKEGTSALDESTLDNVKADEGTEEDNDIVYEHAEQHDTLCRVLLGNGQDEDKENNLDSDKENMTPMLAHQEMTKSITVQQMLSNARLVVTRELKVKDKEKQTSIAISDFEHKEINSEKFAKNPTVSGLCAATTEELINLDKKHEGCSLEDLDSEEPSSQKFDKSGKDGLFSLNQKSFKPASGCELKIQYRQLESLPATSNITENWNNIAKAKQAFYVPCDSDIKEQNSENFDKCYTEEIGSYGSDKENLTPASSQKLKKAQKHLHCFMAALDGVEPNPDKENLTPISHENKKLRKQFSENLAIYEDKEGRSISGKKDQIPDLSRRMKSKKTPETSERITRQLMKNRVERIPFQSLLDNSPSKSGKAVNHVQMKNWLGICSSSSTGQRKEAETNSSISQTLDKAQQKRRIWNIVVDTDCLLDEESRKSLQLLEGIRGTHLIIPRIVIRELDNLKRHESFFRKSNAKASAVLQWIEECMVNLSWWIHVQSSFETVPMPPTPPVTPQSSYDIGNNDLESNSLSFSSYGSLTEIISPTAEDHILDCAILFKKVKCDGHFVLLSNSITLKIKAMAEGLLCETAKEFRESLVNPFSKRFLWADSSPRGSTWSCSEEVGLLEKYYHPHPVIRKPGKAAAEAVKGLKLILLHNSQYGQSQSVK